MASFSEIAKKKPTTAGWLLCGTYTVPVGHCKCPTIGAGVRAVRVRGVGGRNG